MKKNDVSKGKNELGAFCFDVQDSTQRIDRFGTLGFKSHAAFLREAALTYFAFANERRKALESVVRSGEIWIPGDAVWGVLFAEGETVDEPIEALKRVVLAMARGYSVAKEFCNKYGPDEGKQEFRQLKLRGAAILGDVIREELEGGAIKLYNGDALNACGRMQATAGKEEFDCSILFGIMPPREAVANALSLSERFPVIPLEEIKSRLYESQKRWGKHFQPGCEINFDVVEEYPYKDIAPEPLRSPHLRFFSWPSPVKGLKGRTLLVTNVGFRILDDGLSGLHLTKKSLLGRRNIVRVSCASEVDFLTLFSGKNMESFNYLKEVYGPGVLSLHIPSSEGGCFQLKFEKQEKKNSHLNPRPRVAGEKVTSVDLKESRFAILPTGAHVKKPKHVQTVIQGSMQDGQPVLLVSMVGMDVSRKWDHRLPFYDGWGVHLTFKFC